jgi:hypothetical protein
VNYIIGACGPRPYGAVLDLDGNAQLTGITTVGEPVPHSYIKVINNSYIEVNNFAAGSQDIGFYLPRVEACGTSPINPGGLTISSVSVEISGFAAAPFEQSWSGPFSWWHGPHASQSWPSVGNPITNAPIGSFTLNGFSGSWSYPNSLSVNITDLSILSSWSIDFPNPATSVPGALEWSGNNELEPTARLTDSTSVALLQDWIVIFAIIFWPCWLHSG